MKTLVLNIDFSPLSIVNAHRGIVLSLNNPNVKVLKYYDLTYSSESDIIQVPAVLLYYKYVRPPRRKTVSKKYILSRDGMICQYCSQRLTNLTSSVDHVTPISYFDKREDGNTWDNLVACCIPCNIKKRNRKPEEAGMTLIRKPKEPVGFLNIITAPEEWREYVSSVQDSGLAD